jgi:alcohol dehydrogenase
MQPFDFGLLTRLIFGNDTLDRLGELASGMNVNSALVVSDKGIVAAGHVGRAIASLNAVGIASELFDGAHENPTTDDIENGLQVAKSFRPDLLIGLGGGSSLDCAKGINFVYSCGGTIHDYHGIGKATRDLLPMIAIPTTAGTGSEMQSFALISDARTHVKMACGDKRATCRISILDPKLTLTQPAEVTALTGMDAISHALETYVTTRRNPVSILYSREAWRLLAPSFERVLSNPQDLEARAQMQLGAAYAGVAIENSMLGASHALANPLTAMFGTAHGQAVGMMLPHVIRFNGQLYDQWYRELLMICADVPGMPAPDQGAEGLAQFVENLLRKSGLKLTLQELEVQPALLPGLSEAAAKQWTGTFNPRPVDEKSLLNIYQGAL